jgi:hypothetical protein
MLRVAVLALRWRFRLRPAAAELATTGCTCRALDRGHVPGPARGPGDSQCAGQRFVVIVEQRGCIYCTRMHEEVFVEPRIAQLLDEEFFVVRLNMHGSLEAVDFDGEAMEERDLVRRWRNMFTPTMHFFRDEVPEGMTGAEAAVVTMPGALRGRHDVQPAELGSRRRI